MVVSAAGTFLGLLHWYLYVAVAHVIFKLALAFISKLRRLRGSEGVPTPDGARSLYRTVMGFSKEMAANMHRTHDWRHSMMRETVGDCGTMEMPMPMSLGASVFYTTDPAVVEHMLKTKFSIWTKFSDSAGIFWTLFHRFLGKGIFTLRHGTEAKAAYTHSAGTTGLDEDAAWFHQRKVAASIFSRGNFRTLMADVFVEKAHKLIEVIDQADARGPEVDMQHKFFAFTMDSIMAIFYGKQVDTLSGHADPYATAYDTAHRSMLLYVIENLPKLMLMKLSPWPFGPVMMSMATGPSAGFLMPMHRRLNKRGKAFEDSVKHLRSESIDFITKRRMEASVYDDPDLLALFLSSSTKRATTDATGRSGKTQTSPMRDNEDLCDMVLNFIIAGRDTTACCLSWTFYLLSQNPAAEEKLFREVTEVLGDTDPTFDSLHEREMPFLNGIIYESLRLHPPVPSDAKRCTEDCVLPDGTQIPSGSWMFYYPWMMGRDPGRYPDPLAFKPERWIPFKQPSVYEFPVFQGGPRVCLGKDMAIFEAKLLTAMLVRKFRFRMRPEEAAKITYNLSLTMSVCNDKGAKPGTQRSHHLWMRPVPRT